jgi:hypothetical protein
MWLGGLDKFKNPMTAWGIKPATCRLVAQCPKHIYIFSIYLNRYPSKMSVRKQRKGDTTSRHLRADCFENVGASTSHNPTRLHGLLQG